MEPLRGQQPHANLEGPVLTPDMECNVRKRRCRIRGILAGHSKKGLGIVRSIGSAGKQKKV